MMKSVTEYKKIAQAAFRNEFRAEVKLKDVDLVFTNIPGTYIKFRIGAHVYILESRTKSDGSVFTGDGSLTMER